MLVQTFLNNYSYPTARACKWVDEVVENVPYDPTLQLLDSLNCTHIAHGDD
jgi:ethanolamine-phosphate cytidylyltransferase